jgi:hypothetical protein
MITTQTPIWVTLLTSSVGGVIGGLLTGLVTLCTAWITQRNTNRREADRSVREDAARSYEHRHKVYVDFIKEFHHRREEFASGDGEETVLWYDMLLYDHLVQINNFGTNKAKQLAEEAFNTLVNAVEHNEDIPEAEDVLAPLRTEIRCDLSIRDLAQDSVAPPRSAGRG